LIKVHPYKHFNRFIQNETFEPSLSWGLRMAVAAIVPVIWGTMTNNAEAATWITLTAECICWVELKGSFAQRIRVLSGGTVLALLFGILGSITGQSLWWSVLAMLFVGFISGLFKNLGDRGSGLAICVYVLFIIANAFPTHSTAELQQRVLLIAIGGGWNFIIGAVAALATRVQEPYRRTIALIWKANASLLHEITKGWDGASLRSSLRDIYEKEKEVRTAIDGSFHFYEKMAHQVSRSEKVDYSLAQLRKATALIATHIEAISEELESLKVKDVEEELRVKLHATLKALEEAFERMAVYVILLRPEEELLLGLKVSRFNTHLALLREAASLHNIPQATTFARTIQLLERTHRLFESGISQLQQIEDLPVFRSYSLMKTVLILHPKHWWRNTKLLFDLNTFTTRYALRSALAATIAMFLYKWLDIKFGYWIAFTVILVVQPYFGATFKKAVDRVVGTVAGGIVGGLLILVPASLYVQEIMLFVCFVCMVYFIRKRYSVAAFFITLSLVLLFEVEADADWTLIGIRALATACGAALGIGAGFALLPNWDRKWLPIHLSNAIHCNYSYFLATFFKNQPLNWTRHKRSAESKNSNAFDSFNRYMQEPAIKQRPYIVFYQLITHNVRITRELNNIHLEQEGREPVSEIATAEQQEKLNECLLWFNQNLLEISRLNPEIEFAPFEPEQDFRTNFCPSVHQMYYVDKLLFELKALHQGLAALNEQGMQE